MNKLLLLITVILTIPSHLYSVNEHKNNDEIILSTLNIEQFFILINYEDDNTKQKIVFIDEMIKKIESKNLPIETREKFKNTLTQKKQEILMKRDIDSYLENEKNALLELIKHLKKLNINYNELYYKASSDIYNYMIRNKNKKSVNDVIKLVISGTYLS